MKNAIKRVVLLGVVALAGTIGQAQTSTHQEWRFGTASNPAAPDISLGAPSGARVSVAQGEYASGWLEKEPILGASTGVWDLGRKGTMTLNEWSGLTGPVASERQVTVQVMQWHDGGIYREYAAVSMGSARLVSRQQTTLRTESVGDWVIDETKWVIDAGVTPGSVMITSPYDGGLIDRVSVDVSGPSVSPGLSIVTLAGTPNRVQVSWPGSGWVLEGTSDLGNSQSWGPVDATVQGEGTRSTVILQPDGKQFFRLRKQ